MPAAYLLVGAVVYVLLGRFFVSRRTRSADAAFALLNLAAVSVVFFPKGGFAGYTSRLSLIEVALYVAVVCVLFLVLRSWGERAGWRPVAALLAPVGFLASVRYVSPSVFATSTVVSALARRHPGFDLGTDLVGLSYLAFRTSYLAVEVRNGTVKRPGFWRYLGFAFLLPTFAVGPISPYSQHARAFGEGDPPGIPVGRALLRVLVGAVKLRFLGGLANQLTYRALLLDGHPHPPVDLAVAAVAYYLYLYANFSGFCDLAVGGAGLMGIPVAENFDRPFGARNLKEFWNRWHITLSHYMRDVVFSPLSKALVRRLGPARANHAIALAIFVVFFLVGVWHGAGWSFAAFGAMHGAGVAANHYYTIGLKRWLGKERFARYNGSASVRALAVSLTFGYVAVSLFLFANDGATMRNVLSAVVAR